MNIIAGWMIPEMNCARKLAAYIFSLAASNSSMALVPVAEDLDQLVAREHLLDVAVDHAGPLPLPDELPLRCVWR